MKKESKKLGKLMLPSTISSIGMSTMAGAETGNLI